jgi:hypothetical protein
MMPGSDDEIELETRGARGGLSRRCSTRRSGARPRSASELLRTEDAVRRASTTAVPRDWVDYAKDQSTELRSEMIERMSAEFGAWLRTIDMSADHEQAAGENDFELRSRSRASAAARSARRSSRS